VQQFQLRKPLTRANLIPLQVVTTQYRETSAGNFVLLYNKVSIFIDQQQSRCILYKINSIKSTLSLHKNRSLKDVKNLSLLIDFLYGVIQTYVI